MCDIEDWIFVESISHPSGVKLIFRDDSILLLGFDRQDFKARPDWGAIFLLVVKNIITTRSSTAIEH